ncbi:unnamed protein product [Ceutorhynchus assimilis]|uniref:NADH dehydrogenase [ubiquinone] 1 beta subcomplex subunit 11, mitochondrial n=1 Tax=Ceutorhynchus assimilis TaxID=467358 RepID=A0A9N9MCP4_9CUCU|nr:unnamed protein product [Ceutorhynchus assimilis]
MTNFASINRLISHRIRPVFQRRLVSTSKKNNDTVAAEACQSQTNTKVVVKSWVSYGYDHKNKTDDRSVMHVLMFGALTLCGVVGGFVWTYAPDYHLRDWGVREAFLELRRREAEGKLPIDPNFIPVEKIILPSDEELGDTEIII